MTPSYRNLTNLSVAKKSAKGIDKSILLPYNIRREATDTVASLELRNNRLNFLRVAGGYFFLLFRKIRTTRARRSMTTEQNMKNISHVMYTSITSPLFETSGKASDNEKILSQ